MQFYVDVYQKFKLSSPNSPQSTDEEAVEQLIRGQKSIVPPTSSIAAPCSTSCRSRWRTAPSCGATPRSRAATSGSQTFLSMATFEIVRQEGDDADIKQQAAWEFVKEWFLPENQEAYAKTAGLCARQDVWPRLMGAPDRTPRPEPG